MVISNGDCIIWANRYPEKSEQCTNWASPILLRKSVDKAGDSRALCMRLDKRDFPGKHLLKPLAVERLPAGKLIVRAAGSPSDAESIQEDFQ